MTVFWLEERDTDVPAADDWLSPGELLCFERLRIPKRRLEWRLGRWTAKRAVATCLQWPLDCPSLRSIEIIPDASGAPWVHFDTKAESLSISLTHRAGLAACAVTTGSVRLGCDLELIEPHSDAFVTDYFTPSEQQMIAQASALGRDELVATLWSAKESVLKVLRIGLRADTRSVEIDLSDNQTLSAEALRMTPPAAFLGNELFDEWRPLRACFEHDQVLSGWWQACGRHIRTMLADKPVFPPVRIARSVPAQSSLQVGPHTRLPSRSSRESA